MHVLCPSVTAFHAPALSLVHVITSLSAKRKEWGEREIDRGREAERDRPVEWHLSGCPGYCVLGETTPVIAITLAGRAAHTHTHIHWTKTASGRHKHTYTHNSICLNSHVNTEKYCFADVVSKIVPPYYFCWQNGRLFLIRSWLCVPLQTKKSKHI